MKTDISTLPQIKQDELQRIVAAIRETKRAEMIILFGSYARGDWVEDRYDSEHFRYQSDMDILVIVATKSEAAQVKLEQQLEHSIDEDTHINTPVSIIVHDIDFINKRLRKAQYFFKDIKKEGVLLFDSEQHSLDEARELSPKERIKLAQDDFDYYFEKANDLKVFVDVGIREGKLNEVAFLLHQTTERLYTAILLVFTHYKPNTHDLAILRKLTNSLSNELLDVFPMNNADEFHLFKLLRKAYVDARYKPSYKITQDELKQLIAKVDKLTEIGRAICLRKIESFSA